MNLVPVVVQTSIKKSCPDGAANTTWLSAGAHTLNSITKAAMPLNIRLRERCKKFMSKV
jgi:hypothetical protein